MIRLFDLQSQQLHRLSLEVLGFSFPIDGIVIGVDVGLLQRGRNLLRDYAAGRRIKSVSALCRTLCMIF